MVSNLRKNFLCIVWHQKPTVQCNVTSCMLHNNSSHLTPLIMIIEKFQFCLVNNFIKEIELAPGHWWTKIHVNLIGKGLPDMQNHNF